ncbi:uncharacterized protein LOC131430033 [Malaya genurostris]|uniref:uncharacterized protein LOC131430033 n=1 Tax=Malaya genurostris TaxID=325434 RepID=UPI0026F3D62B|nr:uncharacterized protein LOC131430033 [Malaya genurostris]
MKHNFSNVLEQLHSTTDIISGGHRLKNTAVPTQNLPGEYDYGLIKKYNDYDKLQIGRPKKLVSHSSSESCLEMDINEHIDQFDSSSCDELSTLLSNTSITETSSNVECSYQMTNNTEGLPNILQLDVPIIPKKDIESHLDITEGNTIHKTEAFILTDLLLSNDDVNTWTGIQTLDMLQEICLAVKKLEAAGYPKKYSLHCSDRVVLVMTKLKQNLSFAALATLFKIHPATVSKYFGHTVQLLFQILSPFVYMPPKEEIKKNIPLCFRENFKNVTMVLDCTAVSIVTLKCLNCRIATYSQYKSRRTAKFLIGVTPAGLILSLQH